MRFRDYFFGIILILLSVYELIIWIVNSQRIKKINKKIAVKSSIKFNIAYIVLLAVNALLKFAQYRIELGKDDTNARMYFPEFIWWIMCVIVYIPIIFLEKYIYITPDGLFYKSMIKIQLKEKYRYKIDGDTLELYYRQNNKPAKYKIVGDKEELIRILDENYIKYTGELN